MKPLTLLEISPSPLVIHPRQQVLHFLFSEPVMVGSGSIVFRQFIDGNETYIVDTITVDVSQLNLVEDKMNSSLMSPVLDLFRMLNI